MMLFWLIVPLLVIGAIAQSLGWRLPSNPVGPAQPRETPLDILKTRYVRGDISRDEYDQIRRDLEG